MSTRENLTHGPAWIAVAPVGTELPNSAADAAAIVAGSFPGFELVGKTSSPVTFRDNVERSDTRSTQALRASAQHIIGSETEIATELLEVTVDRIVEVLSATKSGASDAYQIDPKSAPGQPTYYSIAVVGPHLADRTILWVAECVAVTSQLELAYGREADTTLSVTWRVYEGTAEGLGDQGYRGFSFAREAVKLPAQVIGDGVATVALDFTDVNETSFTIKVGDGEAVVVELDSDLTAADALVGFLELALDGLPVTVGVTTGNIVTITATNTADAIVVGGDNPGALGLTAGTYAPTTVS